MIDIQLMIKTQTITISIKCEGCLRGGNKLKKNHKCKEIKSDMEIIVAINLASI